MYKARYIEAARDKKRDIAKQILNHVSCLDPPGRFIEETNVGSQQYILVTHENRILEKICQQLREKKVKTPKGMSPFVAPAKNPCGFRSKREKTSKPSRRTKQASEDEPSHGDVRTEDEPVVIVESSINDELSGKPKAAPKKKKVVAKKKKKAVKRRKPSKETMAPIKPPKAGKKTFAKPPSLGSRRSMRLAINQSLQEEEEHHNAILVDTATAPPVATVASKPKMTVLTPVKEPPVHKPNKKETMAAPRKEPPVSFKKDEPPAISVKTQTPFPTATLRPRPLPLQRRKDPLYERDLLPRDGKTCPTTMMSSPPKAAPVTLQNKTTPTPVVHPPTPVSKVVLSPPRNYLSPRGSNSTKPTMTDTPVFPPPTEMPLPLPPLKHTTSSASCSSIMPEFLRGYSSMSFRGTNAAPADSFEAGLEGIVEPPPLTAFSSGFSFGSMSGFKTDQQPTTPGTTPIHTPPRGGGKFLASSSRGKVLGHVASPPPPHTEGFLVPPTPLQSFNSLFIEGMPSQFGSPVNPNIFMK